MQLFTSVAVCAIFAVCYFGKEGFPLLLEFLAKRRNKQANEDHSEGESYSTNETLVTE